MNFGLLATVSGACLFAAPAHAQTGVADFYRGKQLRIVVGPAVSPA